MSSTTKSEDGSPSCWICLCEEPDDNGKLPVRDCSCRGDSAGYAHLSCLVKYAQTKSRKAANNDKFLEVWQTCPNCEQPYQHQLALDLANSLLLFVEDNYSECINPGDYFLVIGALDVKTDAINTFVRLGSSSNNKQQMRREGIETANKVLSLLEDMKSKFGTDTAKSASLLRTISDNEASTYNELAAYHSDDLEKSIYYNNLSLDIYESIGDIESTQTVQAIIDLKRDESNGTAVESLRHLFNEAAQDETVYGCNSAEAIDSVIGTASYLLLSNHAIEAERLLEKYVPISCRVHGNEHDKTKKIKKFLDRCKTRLVTLDYGHDESGVMQALRYEDGGNKCVIQGPVEVDNVIYFALTEGATEYTVDSSSLLFAPGIPIICQGLQKAAHLNGKLADIRSYDKNKERYTIYFEDTSLKPVAVKRKNVRIVFDLPDVE